MAKQDFIELVQGLSEVITTNDIGIEDDSALLIVNKQLVLAKYIASMDRLFLATGVCTLRGDQNHEAVFSRLLRAQLFLGESNAATFGYFEEKNIIVLQRAFPVDDLNSEELFGHLKRLVETAIKFRDEIKNMTGYDDVGEDSFTFMMNAIRV